MKFKEFIDSRWQNNFIERQRVLSMWQKYFIESHSILKNLKNSKVIASASSDRYSVNILDNGWYIWRYSDAKYPVAQGIWQGNWDEDLAKFVSLEDYDKSSRNEKATYDAMIQLEMYVADEFFWYYAFLYYPEEFNAWYYTQNGEKLSIKDGNVYWKLRLKEEGKLAHEI